MSTADAVGASRAPVGSGSGVGCPPSHAGRDGAAAGTGVRELSDGAHVSRPAAHSSSRTARPSVGGSPIQALGRHTRQSAGGRNSSSRTACPSADRQPIRDPGGAPLSRPTANSSSRAARPSADRQPIRVPGTCTPQPADSQFELSDGAPVSRRVADSGSRAARLPVGGQPKSGLTRQSAGGRSTRLGCSPARGRRRLGPGSG
jgi:hypothetical protein